MEYYSGKRVLVPGGAGFIGSHLVDALLALGASVTVIDNLHTGCRSNFSPASGHNRFHFVEKDVSDPIDGSFDLIFNMACPASPVHYQADPIGTWRTSILGMANLLEYCKETGARLVHTSTSEVYGDPLEHPQKETYWGNVNPVGERSCYDEGKRAAETLAYDYHRMHGVDVRLPRIFNTYGPRMARNDGRVVSNFITQALEGRDITIYGDGSNTRSFCYVSDMVEVLLRIGAADGIGGEVFNVGNPGEFTISELGELVLSLTGSPSKLVYRPLPKDDPTRRRPDIGKVSAKLDWTPVVPLQEGLEKTIAYFSSEHSVARVIGQN